MLLNDFYKILKINKISDNEIVAEISINAEHKIFNGHFPENPVVPGVVSVQIINEILSEYLNKKLMTSKARNIKFPAMINPKINSELNVKINFSQPEKNTYKINAEIYFKETVFLKFNGNFNF
ncbi:MAG: hypothetical protein L3J56_08500 [Bacteroidales bacterium]|nr:hypothetical protein [Bacteroidales bacterium]